MNPVTDTLPAFGTFAGGEQQRGDECLDIATPGQATSPGKSRAPTVLDYVQNDHELVACETFGPVAPVLRFRTLDEALRIANDSPHGLSDAVVSNHWPSIQRVITELETGTVNINAEPSYRLEWSPFGGFKSSGLGDKEGVIEAMKGMTRIKTYSLPWDQP